MVVDADVWGRVPPGYDIQRRDGALVLVELQKVDEDMVFEPADANVDGKVTLSEYVDQRFESFDEADVNSDGLLSVEEVIDAYEGP